MSSRKPSSIATKIVATFAIAALSLSAFAGRYWRGETDDALFSNTENWATSSGGAGGNSYPGQNGDEGTTYYRNYLNGLCVIDGAYTVPGDVDIGTASSSYFVWRANASTSGITTTGNFVLGYDAKNPNYLEIDGGTYSFGGTVRTGYNADNTVGLVFKGDSFTGNKVRVSGGRSGVNGTVEIKGGVFSAVATGDDVFMVCDQANTKGTLVIEGGTLNTTNGNQVCVGGVDEIDAQIYVNTGGVWNAKVLLLGGKRRSTTYEVTNSVTKLYVNGGTLNLSGENGIGYAKGEGSSAEMIVNDGEVNCNYGYFYLAERAAGALTINGGTFTMTSNSDGGLTFGRNTTEPGILTLNGGVLATSKLRLDKLTTAGNKAIFNGGTLKALNGTSSFINASDYIECVIKDGGLVVDTDGYDITIKHAFVDEDGTAASSSTKIGTITKKGNGTLTLSAAFPEEKIIVQKGTVSANGTTYTPVNETSNQSRYWLGATQDTLVSEDANWASEEGGSGGASSIDTDYLGKVYFPGGYTTGAAVFDSAVELANAVSVGAASTTPLVWSATAAANGFDNATGDVILGYDSSHATADLQIDSGTYSCNYLRLGYTENADAELVVKGGAVTTAKGRIGGGVNGAKGTLAITNGTVTSAGELYVLSGNKTGGMGDLIVDGGTLVTTAPDYVRVGETGSNATGTLHMVSGTWNTKSFLVGGPTKKSQGNYAGLHGYIIVDGGTINASADCSIGANVGEGARSEMIINGGTVNINANMLYVGDGGPGYLTVNGGELNIKDSADYGIGFGHIKNDGTGSDPAHIVLNGGTVTMSKFRMTYLAPGSTLVFNGGVLKATRDQVSYLEDAAGLTCEIAEGGLIFDTNGHDVTIAHDLTGVGGIVKRGLGTLTLSGNNSFQGEIVIEEGDVVDGERFDIDGLAYTTVLDVESDGQDLGTVQLHRSPLSAWLANPDFETYSSVYGSNGTESRETPRYIAVAANGVTNTYMNLNTASNVTGTVGGLAYSFTTEAVAPRTLRIDFPSGYAYNVRDVGSWPLESVGGKKMNQDVIIRGGHLDGFVDATAEQRSAGYLSSIGLKTEIDLRIVGLDGEMPTAYQNLDADGADNSFAADNCKYYRFGLGWGVNEGTQIGADADGNFTNQVRKTFSTLGTEGRLPAYFHCRIGTDRTGIMGLLLLGLMGVEEEVLYRDYLMSNFANIGGSRDSSIPETFIKYLLRGDCNSGKYAYTSNDATYGRSIASRCRQYLQMCGVTDEEIGRITMALSGETPDEVLARVDAYEAENNFRTVSYVPYEGSSTTNAIHRFGTNGGRILPRDTPTRDGYTFKGWDVENEQDTDNGTAVVYAKWESSVVDEPHELKWDNAVGDYRLGTGGNWYVNNTDPRVRETPGTGDTCLYESKYAALLEGDEINVKEFIASIWGSAAYYDITNGTIRTTGDFVVGRWGGGCVANMYGGEVEAYKFVVCQAGAYDNCRMNVYGGTITALGGGWPGALGICVQGSGRGEMYIYGGEVTANNTVQVGYADGLSDHGGPSAETASKLVVDGGKLDVTAGSIQIADSNGGSSAGRLVVSSGTLTAAGDMNIAASTAAWAQVDITGGKATVGGTIRVGNNANAQHAVLNVAGGELDANEISVARQCDGTLYITDGGVVSANQIQKAQGAPAGASPKVFIDDGTIVAKKDTGLFFASVDSVTIGEGGAAFDTAGYNVTIEACRGISGIGSFTKKGSGTLEVKGDSYGIHCDWKVRGKIIVEAGTLKLPANQTIYCEGTQVADGATLNLNGSTIVVVTMKITESLWTNATGDGNASNPSNWRSTIKYFDENGAEVTAIEESLDGILPTADTDVKVPLDCVHPDMSGISVKSTSLYGAAGTQHLRGVVQVPAVAKEAKCWFDFDDVSTVTLAEGSDVNLASIANKGTAKDTFASAVVYGKSEARDPRYGDNGFNGRKVMLQTDIDEVDGESSKGMRTEELGLEGDHDRTLVVVCRRGPDLPNYGLGIESDMWDDKKGHFRIRRHEWDSNCEYTGIAWDNDKQELALRPLSIGIGQDPTGWVVRMFQSEKQAGEECLLTSRAYSETNGETIRTVYATNLNTQASARLYMGYRLLYDSPSRGQIAEAFYFDRALTTAEQAALQSYLAVKWLTPCDSANIPSDVLLEDGATLDFGGGTWTFDTVKGSGTIGTANIVVEGSIEPGLVVEGSVSFTEGATIDISCFDRSAPGGEVVFLTADSIENWPRKVRSSRRLSALRLVENQDGTVSLVGKVAAIGLGIRLR